MRHRPVRPWWRLWKRRCACGCTWYPCPDTITLDRPGVDPAVLRRNFPQWYAPTVRMPAPRNERPFLTPGQEWRSRNARHN